MNEANFVKRMNWLVSGDSFIREMEVPLSNVRDASGFHAVVASGVAATGTLTVTDQPDDLDEVRIGPYTYTFDVTTLVDVPFHVLIAATASLTLDNLISAVNNTGTEGTDYGTLTPQNPAVSAAAGAGDTIDFTARVVGAQGNSIPTAGVGGPGNDGLSGQSWSEATFAADALTGGTGSPAGDSSPAMVQDGLSFDDGDTALVDFILPMDYDQDGDQCVLKLVVTPVSAGAATTDIGITTAQRIHRAGAAVDATVSTARAEDATASTSALTREVYLSLSGRSFEPGDALQFLLDVNNSGSIELIVNRISVVYGAMLAAYNDDDRRRDMTATTGD